MKKILGPGFITGASDNDPSGIATYSQAGAQFGYKQLWTALFTLPFLIVVQEMCTRISIVSKKGLGTLLRENYPISLTYFTCLILAIGNIINIGADLSAMAECANLILPINFNFYLFFFVMLTLGLEIFLPYRKYAKLLLFFSFFLILYVFLAFCIKQDWNLIARKAIIPTIEISKEYILNLIAILGTTISPYLFFWQSEQQIEEIEEQLKKGERNKTRLLIKYMRIDTIFGMVISNCIMFFIIIATAATLHAHGITNIESADEAARALEPLVGHFAALIFAIGVIGMGLLSIPVLAGSLAYLFAEAFEKRKGLDNKFVEAKFFYVIITVSVLIGVLVNFVSIQPFKMLYYSAAINGLLSPILIFIITLLANNKKIMRRRANSFVSNILSGILILLLTISSTLFFIFLF